MIVGHRVGAPVRSRDGSADQLGHAGNFIGGVAPLNTAPGDDHRTLGGQQQVGRFVDQVPVAPAPGLPGPVGLGGQRLHLHFRPRQQVSGDVHHDRSHLTRGGDSEGVAQGVGQALCLVYREAGLGDGLEQGYLVELLSGVPVLMLPGGRGSQNDHRRVGHVGRPDAKGEIQHAGSVGN